MIDCSHDSKGHTMFMYTLRRHPHLTDLANALGPDDQDAINQVSAYLRGINAPVPLFRLSDDPQSEYYLEKRPAIPSPHGPGWTNDPHGPVEVLPLTTH